MSFNLYFFCEDLDASPKAVEVIVGPFTFMVKIVVNFSSPQVFHEDSSSSQGDDDRDDISNGERDFWM